jgi:hypothetical protein
MSVFDSLWNVSQERQLDELRRRLEEVRSDPGLAGSPDTLLELVNENAELKLRLALLVRLLIAKGVMTAQEYAELIAVNQSVQGESK